MAETKKPAAGKKPSAETKATTAPAETIETPPAAPLPDDLVVLDDQGVPSTDASAPAAAPPPATTTSKRGTVTNQIRPRRR
jgi:hypothetical protein